MTDAEIRELVIAEVRRYISPGMFYALLALVFALLFATWYLWTESRTQYAWIVKIKADVEVLKAESWFTDKVDEIQGTIHAIAESLGVIIEEKGNTDE